MSNYVKYIQMCIFISYLVSLKLALFRQMTIFEDYKLTTCYRYYLKIFQETSCMKIRYFPFIPGSLFTVIAQALNGILEVDLVWQV